MRRVKCQEHIFKEKGNLDEGESRASVAKRFKIGKTTLYEWQQRRKETGDFQSKKLGNIITKLLTGMYLPNLLKNMELSEMAKLWGNINFRTIHRALKKIGFTRKIRPMDIKKGMKCQIQRNCSNERS